MKPTFNLLLIVVLLMSCNSSDKASNDKDSKEGTGTSSNISDIKPTEKQFNINILWDLSDRIDPITNPSSPQHYERDIEAIKTISEIFKKDMEKKGAFKAKGRLRVFFTPPPADPTINTIAKNLVFDLSAFKGDGATKKKKEIYDSLLQKISTNTDQIYSLTIQGNKGKKQWDGSDIWRFFKNDVKDYCIEPDTTFRNILIILTDGYIYHKDSRDKKGNRTAYLLPELLKPFRNNSEWQTTFSKGDYGLITTRNDLKSLEVLVLEITPSRDYKNDEDYIKAYLGKWFEEMGISKEKYSCFNSDLPAYTRKKIEQFLNK